MFPEKSMHTVWLQSKIYTKITKFTSCLSHILMLLSRNYRAHTHTKEDCQEKNSISWRKKRSVNKSLIKTRRYSTKKKAYTQKCRGPLSLYSPEPLSFGRRQCFFDSVSLSVRCVRLCLLCVGLDNRSSKINLNCLKRTNARVNEKKTAKFKTGQRRFKVLRREFSKLISFLLFLYTHSFACFVISIMLRVYTQSHIFNQIQFIVDNNNNNKYEN